MKKALLGVEWSETISNTDQITLEDATFGDLGAHSSKVFKVYACSSNLVMQYPHCTIQFLMADRKRRKAWSISSYAWHQCLPTHTRWVNVSSIHEFTQCVWAPPTMEVLHYSALNVVSDRNAQRSNVRFLPGTATHVNYMAKMDKTYLFTVAY